MEPSISPTMRRAGRRLHSEFARRARLKACLDGLHNRSRNAIRAAFFENLTYDAVAKKEAVPLSTMIS